MEEFNVNIRQCKKCHAILKITEFTKCNRSAGGRIRTCRQCKGKYNKLYRKKNLERLHEYDKCRLLPERKEAARLGRLKRVYKLTKSDFDQLWKKQKGFCAICKTKLVIGIQNGADIDHDHESGKIRGLLCRHCNLGLGHFRDNYMLIEKALRYLK